MSIKLLLGDCLDLMNGIKDGSIDLVLTDPPYGTTACKWDSVIPFEPMWEQLKRVIKPNGAIVLFCNQPFTSLLISSNVNQFRYTWVWDKGHATGHLNARKRPMKLTEDVAVFYATQCLYFPQNIQPVNKPAKNSRSDCARSRTNTTSTVSGGLSTEYIQKATGYPRNLISFKSCNGNKYHPTQKPVALMEYLIKTYTNKGETVLDFAMGSGTTGVACVNTGRSFIGIELDEAYFYMAIERTRSAKND